MKYRLICFDFDGTLVQTTQAVTDSLKITYQTLKKQAPAIDTIETVIKQGKPTKEMFQLLTPEANEALINQFFDTYIQVYLKEANSKTKLFPYVREILIQLTQAGIATSIISNKSNTELKSAIKYFRLNNYITTIIGTDSGSICKPNPKIYDLYLAPNFPTIQRHKILMVGDTLTDLKFAQAIQVDACWASYGEGNPTDCEKLKPHYTIQSLQELVPIIFN